METIRQPTRQLLTHGIIGGILAGVAFVMVDMILAAVQMGAPFYAPLRMMGAIALGSQALQESYPFVQAAVAAVAVHMVLSALYGVVFVYLLAAFRQLRASTGALLAYGSIFGLALWVLNFLIIAPIAFPWFGMVNQFWFGFVAHTFFYGTVLGAYVGATRPGTVESYG